MELDEDEKKIVDTIRGNQKVTAKGLAKVLHFSEGAVRSKLTQIYRKFEIVGDDRDKRQMLIEKLGIPTELTVHNPPTRMRCGVVVYFVLIIASVIFLGYRDDHAHSFHSNDWFGPWPWAEIIRNHAWDHLIRAIQDTTIDLLRHFLFPGLDITLEILIIVTGVIILIMVFKPKKKLSPRNIFPQ